MRQKCVISAFYIHMTLKFCQYFVTEGRQNERQPERYTLRIDQALLDKLGYIAEYEGRTKNRELEQMIKKRIRDFEQEHGEIDLHNISKL